MPRGDGTGPMGQGPRSGRGMGFCAGYGAAGYQNSGRGRDRFFPEDERAYLNNQLGFLENEIQEIKKRLAQIDEKKG